MYILEPLSAWKPATNFNSRQLHSWLSPSTVIQFACRECKRILISAGGRKTLVSRSAGRKSYINVKHLKAQRNYFLDYLIWFSILIIASCDSFHFSTLHRPLECVEYLYLYIYMTRVNPHRNSVKPYFSHLTDKEAETQERYYYTIINNNNNKRYNN